MPSIRFSLSQLLGRDLAGRLASATKRYKRTPWMLGADELTCAITEWRSPDSFEICVGCYCNDPASVGDMSNHWWFYRNGSPKNRKEADSLLLQQVAHAALAHPSKRFFYQREKSGQIEEYVNGAWTPTHDKPSSTRCSDCGQPADPPTCKKCGGFVFS